MSVTYDLKCCDDRTDCLVELGLSNADLPDHHQDLTVTFVPFAHDLLVHLEGLLEKRQSIFVVSSLHVAVPKQGQNVRVVLLGRLNLSQKATVQLQGCGKVVQRLLEIARTQVSFTELGVRGHQHKEVLPVHVDEQLAKGKLLNPSLDRTLNVLLCGKFIKLLVPLNYTVTLDLIWFTEFPTDLVVHGCFTVQILSSDHVSGLVVVERGLVVVLNLFAVVCLVVHLVHLNNLIQDRTTLKLKDSH